MACVELEGEALLTVVRIHPGTPEFQDMASSSSGLGRTGGTQVRESW
jgi:hypothetical protein